MAERLEAPDRAAELLALLDVGEHVLEGPLGQADGLRGDDQPLVVQPRHQLHPGLALDDRRGCSAGTSQSVKKTSLTTLARPSCRCRGSRPRRQPAGTESIVSPLCLSDPVSVRHTSRMCSACWALGDPRLLAVDHVAAVARLGPAAQVAHVGAGLGLGHRDRLHGAADDPAGGSPASAPRYRNARTGRR